MYKKRGISHLEVLLAFVIFFVFVGFVLYFFGPVRSARLIESSLPYAVSVIEKNVTVDLVTYYIEINRPALELTGGDVLGINISSLSPSWKIRAENYSGHVLNSTREVAHGEDMVYVNASSNDVIVLKMSDAFSGDSLPLHGNDLPYCNESLYKIASSTKQKVISEQRLIDVVSLYNSDYSGFKDRFNLPKTADYSIQLIEPDKIIEANHTVPNGLEVYSNSERLQIITNQGDTIFADFVVKIW